MNQHEFERVLVLSPHTDDAEIACGGTMAKLLRDGAHLKSIAFSGCESQSLLNFLRMNLERSFIKHTRRLELKEKIARC